MNVKMRIRKGDEVVVITGKDKGKKGSVLSVMPKFSRVVVSGVNLVKRHLKPTKTSEGGIVTKERSIHISNLSHIDPKDGKPTKITFVIKDGQKLRVSKRSGLFIDGGDK